MLRVIRALERTIRWSNGLQKRTGVGCDYVYDVDYTLKLLRALPDISDYVQHLPGCVGMYPPHKCDCGYKDVKSLVDQLSTDDETTN
jgi:hypothetical protein